jgi:hypothetical protein
VRRRRHDDDDEEDDDDDDEDEDDDDDDDDDGDDDAAADADDHQRATDNDDSVHVRAAALTLLFAMYLADLAMILANSYVLASSIARTSDTSFDALYKNVTFTLSYQLPTWVAWFPKLFSTLVARFAGLIQGFSFNIIVVRTLSVTCVGAQATGKAFTNVVLGAVIFVAFEVYFFEFIRVTFQGISVAAPRYYRPKHPNYARFLSLFLPGERRVWSLLSSSS